MRLVKKEKSQPRRAAAVSRSRGRRQDVYLAASWMPTMFSADEQPGEDYPTIQRPKRVVRTGLPEDRRLCRQSSITEMATVMT